MPSRRRVALQCVIAGVLVALSVPPLSWWPLAFVGLGVLCWRLVGLPWRRRVLAGWTFGLGMFAVTWFWMSEFHAVGYTLAVPAEALFMAFGAVLVPPDRLRALMAFPFAFTAADVVRGIVPFGGLPLGGVPLGQVGGPLAPATRVGGALLLTFLAAAIGVGLVAFRRRVYPAFLGTLIAAAAVVAVSDRAPDGENVRSLRVALLQGGGPRGFRAVETDAGDVFRRHVETAGDLDGPVDFVLWPENVIDVSDIDGTEEADILGAIAEDLDAPMVSGVTEDAEDDNFRNVAIVWSSDGELGDRYVKTKRVPFGEYVPGRFLFEKVADLSVLPRDAVPGGGDPVLDTEVGRVAVSISYEVFFSARSRDGVRLGGRIVLVPTNAASFTTAQMPQQELAAARLRAWETGRWVLQAAPTGYTAVVSPRGELDVVTELGERRIVERTVALRSGLTPYGRWGDGPLVVLVVLGLLLAWRPATRPTTPAPMASGTVGSADDDSSTVAA